MSTLLNPRHTAGYDAANDRVVVTFRDGRDASVIELDPETVPTLINAIMAARHAAKQARKAVPLPPPMVRPPMVRPPIGPADLTPIRLQSHDTSRCR